MEPITVLLADDHELILEALESMLTVDGHVKVVGHATEPAQAVRMARKLQPEIVLMDYHFQNSNRDGIDCVREIRECCPKTNVIMLTQYDDHRIVIEALKAGAVGYALKSGGREQLMDAIIAARNGEACLAPSLQRKLIGELAQEMPVRDVEADDIASRLTPREMEVLKLLVHGLRNPQIAEELSVSLSTVKTYIRSIFDKFGSTDRTQVAVAAVTKGIVMPPDTEDRVAPRQPPVTSPQP
ncbi:MAG: response regulator [Armatimonadota bacterium]